MKSNLERSVEALTWATVVIWLGFVLIFSPPVWLVLMILSIILLTSAIYQRSRGWQTSMMIWIAGVWMAVFSVVEIVSEFIDTVTGEHIVVSPLVYLGITLISMGLAVVFRMMQIPTLTAPDAGARSRSSARGRAAVDPVVQQRSVIPRQIQEDRSTGYYASPGQRAAQQPRSRQIQDPRDQPLPGADQYTQPVQQRTSQSRVQPRVQPRSQPAPPPSEVPSDMENRVEDIIRRSRERRDKGGNLPY